ncbi:16765_t:CDS:2, partial [Racocetra fulgida]
LLQNFCQKLITASMKLFILINRKNEAYGDASQSYSELTCVQERSIWISFTKFSKIPSNISDGSFFRSDLEELGIC